MKSDNYIGMPSISIIVPVLNEADNISILIPQLCDEIGSLGVEIEILVVDDSSTDGTVDLLKMLSEIDSRIRLISRVGEERSLPSSIYRGVCEAQYETVAWLDGDGSMPASALKALVQSNQSSTCANVITVGSRFIKGGRVKGLLDSDRTSPVRIWRNLQDSGDHFWGVIFSYLLNKYLWVLCGHFCRDMTSGFVVAKRSLVHEIGLRGNYGDYFVEFLFSARSKGICIIEVPYVCRPRIHGESKTGTNVIDYVRRGARYVSLPVRLRFGQFIRNGKSNN